MQKKEIVYEPPKLEVVKFEIEEAIAQSANARSFWNLRFRRIWVSNYESLNYLFFYGDSFVLVFKCIKSNSWKLWCKNVYCLDGAVVEEPLIPVEENLLLMETIDGTFLYWIINGAILKIFRRPTAVTSKLHMKAYYVSSTKHAVVFITNLQV